MSQTDNTMASPYEQAQAAAAWVRERGVAAPRVGVVLGSGLGAFAARLGGAVRLPYSDVPHFPRSTVVGHAGELVLGTLQDVPCAVLGGRVHHYEGHGMERLAFAVRTLGTLGIKSLVVTNAAGGANPAFVPGDFMVIEDHINLMGDTPLRGPNDARLGPRFFDMTQAYCPQARSLLHDIARAQGLELRSGVYAALPGPNYETPAEVRYLQRMGADAVGMSTVPEVLAARHMGIRVVGLSVITNRCAGLSAEPLSHAEVTEVGRKTSGALCELLEVAVPALGLKDRA